MPKDKTTANKIKDLETSVEGLKSAMFDLTTRNNETIKRLNELSAVFDYHAHPTVLTSQRPFFLEEQYRAAMQEQEAKANPAQQPETPPIPKEEPAEE